MFQTASWQLWVPLLESFLGWERLPGLAHGWVLQWNQAHTDDSALVCQSDCSEPPPAPAPCSSSSTELLLSSFSPAQRRANTTLWGQRGSSLTGGWLPQNRSQFQSWDSPQESRMGTGHCPQAVTMAPLWLCSEKGADLRYTMEQDVPCLSALPRNCSFDRTLLRTSELGLSFRNSSYYWFSPQTALSV